MDRPWLKLTTRQRKALLAAPVYVPAFWRLIDGFREDGTDGLSEEGLDIEHVEILSLDGTPLHMTVCGKGPKTLFFVHGWTCNETVYRFQQRHFKDRYRIYSVELRGHGSSSIPESLDYHPDRLAEDLEAAVRYAKPRTFAVCGHSMGGFTAFKWFELFGAKYKGRLKGLAIIDSTGTDLAEGVVFGSVMKRTYPIPLGGLLKWVGHNNKVSDLIKGAVKETHLAYGIVRWAAFGKRPKGDHVEHMRKMILATPMTSLALAAKACMDYHVEYFLPQVDVPVILLLGDRDKLTNLEVNRRTADLLPDARMKVYVGAGHCSLLERRDEFNADLDAFLSEIWGPRA